MAKRLTDEQWSVVKQDYEVHGMTYSQLVEKYGVGKATLSRRANKEGWKKGKSEHLVQEKVNAIKALKEVEHKVEQLVPLEQLAVNREAELRLAREEMFVDSALFNQRIANDQLANSIALEEGLDGKYRPKLGHNGKPVYHLDFKDLKAHAELTAKNKETVLGKELTTAVQVNNNLGEGSVIDQLVQKHKDKFNES